MKYVYLFGNGVADGTAKMKNTLGGKGANLAEMNHLGIPVPPGFTITTEVCSYYYDNGKNFPDSLDSQLKDALLQTENIMGSKFGYADDPLLVSIRSGARQSMPGMMETVLNVGLTSETIPGLIKKTGNDRFVYDAYRRLIMMYADVVMEKAAGLEPEGGVGIRHKLESLIENHKSKNQYINDTDLSGEDWKELSEIFKDEIRNTLGADFPDDPHRPVAEPQFLPDGGDRGGHDAVFLCLCECWHGDRCSARGGGAAATDFLWWYRPDDGFYRHGADHQRDHA